MLAKFKWIITIFNIKFLIILFGLIVSNKNLYEKAIINFAYLALNKSYINTTSIRYPLLLLSKRIFLEAQKFFPGNPSLVVSLEMINLLECNPQLNHASWRQVAPYPDQQSLFLSLWIIEQTSRYCSIESTCKLAISLWPEYPHAYLRLGSFYYEQKQFDKAIEILEQGVKTDFLPNNSNVYTKSYYLIARSYHALRDIPHAELFYQKTIETDPYNRWMWYTNSSYIYLGDLALKRKDFEQSARYYVSSYSVAINEKQRQQARLRIEQLLKQTPDKDKLKILELAGHIIHE